MKPSRREVLWTAAALGSALVAPGLAEARTPRYVPAVLPNGFAAGFVPTRQAFTEQLKQLFGVHRPGEGMYRLGLVAVLDGAAAAAAGTVGSEFCFTAIFVGPAADPLPEATYQVSPPGWATSPMFLKRSIAQDGYQYYEAPFNSAPGHLAENCLVLRP